MSVPIDLSKLGMSDLSTVVGISPYQTQIELVERIKYGLKSESNMLQELGHHMEPFALAQWERVTGGRSKGPRAIPLKSHPWLRANLDADAELGGSPLVVDGKHSGHRMSGHWGDGEDEIPEWMIPQMQGYLWVTKYTRCDVVAILGGSDLRIYTVRPDVELQEMLIEAASKFWRDYIEGDALPDVDGTEGYREFLSRKFPKPERPLLTATPESDLLAGIYREASRAKEVAELKAEEAKNRLKALIGDAEGIRGESYSISWRKNKDTLKTDWEALAKEIGPPEDLIQKHTNPRPGPRVFRLTTRGEKS